MKSFEKVITFNTAETEEVINITSECRAALAESGIREGLALIFPLHTSSCVFISDSDPGIAQDYRDLLARLAPAGAGYRHDETDHKKNAHGHLRAILTGHHVTCPVSGGEFHFGTYHTVYYLEFDGKRPKEVLIKIIGE
jgi:secondary thiamine-phosphate synthase enzyme